MKRSIVLLSTFDHFITRKSQADRRQTYGRRHNYREFANKN